MNAAIGIEQLKKLDKFVKIRRQNGAIYKKLFTSDEKFLIQKENNSKSSWFAFSFIIKKEYSHLLPKVFKKLKKTKLCLGDL